MSNDPHTSRPQWKSRMGFILAAIGSAVGLGNIWRFSYLCYKNGGGAFLVPYAIALFAVGIPLMILELSLGHKMKGSPPLSFGKIGKKWEWVGWWAVIAAMFGIMLYYSVVISWCVSYVFFSFNLSWGTDPNNFFFNEYLQITEGPFDFGEIRGPIILSSVLVWLACWFIVFKGVVKGVEQANKIFMPILVCLILILVGWSVTLEGAWEGLKVYLKPDFSLLGNIDIWIDAFSQIFFTLSLGFGIMIAYASYLPRKTNLIKDALIICFGNSLFSFIAGFAVFGTLGYMAYATNQPVDEVVTESIGLAFVTYPKAISLMPAFANVFGVMFFSMLVIAGLSSAISLVEAFSAAVIDKFHFRRETVVSVVCLAGFLGSIIFTTKNGLFWIDIVDHFITHYGLVIIGFLECIIAAWFYKASKLREHINHTVGYNIPEFFDTVIKFLTPAVLLFLIGNDLITEFAEPYEGYSWIAIILIGRDWVIGALLAAMFFSIVQWKQEPEDK